MLKNYFKIAVRNLYKNKAYSFINIIGLAVGMSVVMLIGLWMHDELSFDKSHTHYDRIARVIVHQQFNNQSSTQWAMPLPVGEELRTKYGSDFERVVMASWSYGHFLENGKNKFSKEGMFAEPGFIPLASLNMTSGTADALKEPHRIILNRTLAAAFFGKDNPMGKTIRIDNFSQAIVSGVFEDFPDNSSFASTQYVISWGTFVADYQLVKMSALNWGNFSYQAFVQLKPGANERRIAAKIKNVIIDNNPQAAGTKTALDLFPMKRWHLYNNFENGINTGGDIQFVWLFGIIGAFVLLLACINFMNLSTARSEKRAREVGIRKAVGSLRKQLVIQFLGESFVFVLAAFLLSLIFVQLSLPWFNALSEKKLTLLLNHPYFWLACVSFILLTGLLAGSYPALYISSFKPVTILKGSFKVGKLAAVPRKVLVVVQFTVSVALITGTMIIYRQIMYARERPIGYNYSSLVTTYGYPFGDQANNPVQYDYLKNQLMETGGIISMAKSSSPTTGIYTNHSEFDWEGRQPDAIPNFGVIWCSHDYGKTIGLQFVAGRDFSRQFTTDTAAVILNEAAAKTIGFDKPLNKTISFFGQPFTIIGVVKDLLMESPYATVRPTVFMANYNMANIITMKLNPQWSVQDAIRKIEPVFKRFRPESLFECQFVDEQFNEKFTNEERIGKIASFFAILAVFISCLGLSGLASFVAGQRTREIGIRKVLGASVLTLFHLLSKEFILLVSIACCIAMPVAWYFLHGWLQQFEYRTSLSWWIFALAISGALLITLLTVSIQAIRAALMNPVKSLRSE